jgi:hypothetical protein
MEQERSAMPGYPFFAHAELLVENSDVCLSANVSELSREGCQLHLANTFPAGTSVVVKIYAWPHFFQARGTVCYSERNLGVGIVFTEIERQYTSVLDALLLEAEDKRRKRNG